MTLSGPNSFAQPKKKLEQKKPKKWILWIGQLRIHGLDHAQNCVPESRDRLDTRRLASKLDR